MLVTLLPERVLRRVLLGGGRRLRAGLTNIGRHLGAFAPLVGEGRGVRGRVLHAAAGECAPRGPHQKI